MVFKHAVKTAFLGLRTHRLRSILTLLGIVIGITAIIIVMSLGKGAQSLIVSQIQGLGSKTIIILPGRQPKGVSDFSAVSESLKSDSLKEREVEALSKKSNVPNLSRIMPIVFGFETTAYGSETFQGLVLGGSELIPQILSNLYPTQGNFFTEDDVRDKTNVAVIGTKVKKELFGENQALGEKIKIKGTNFRIIGILPVKGQGSFINFDEAIIIPYTTAQQYIFGIKHFNRLIAEADSESNVSKAVYDIKTTLRVMHNTTDPENDDFNIQTQENILQSISKITDIMIWFLVAVAAISLLVGGIGIMNIMLVSVTERTREIGLRKAVGATTENIMIQFLMEAVILTAGGGIIGVLLGVGFSFAMSQILSLALKLNWEFSFPLLASILGFSVAAVIGLVFGLYPARKASLKSPIEAIRYE